MSIKNRSASYNMNNTINHVIGHVCVTKMNNSEVNSSPTLNEYSRCIKNNNALILT